MARIPCQDISIIKYQDFLYVRAYRPEEFRRTVTLYHGTSSWLKPDIQMYGLCPPDVDNIIERVLDDFRVREGSKDRRLERDELPDKIFRDAISLRKGSNFIFMTSDFGAAAKYARAYCKDGGEIAFDVTRGIKLWAKIEGKELSRVIRETRPIVVELEIPWKILTGIERNPIHPATKMKRILNRALEELAPNLPAWKAWGHKSLEDYLKQEGFEWVTRQSIPSSMITKIHEV